MIALILAAATAAAAPPPACVSQGDPRAGEVILDAAHSAGLMMSIPIVIKLHGLTNASLEAFPDNCDRGRFQAGGRTYVLTGENADPNAPRRAFAQGAGATDKRAPVAFLAEAFDLGPSLAAPPDPGAEPKATAERWVLGTALNDVMVVWRAYDAIPDDDRLRADMAAVLAPGATPVMRFPMKGGPVQVLEP